MPLGIVYHFLDLVVGECAGAGDRDVLLAPSRLVLRGHGQDAVAIKIEYNLDLGETARSGGNSRKMEAPQRLILRGPRPLALQHIYLDRVLVIGGCRVRPRLLRRYRAIPRDHDIHHIPQRLDAQRQRRDVHQYHVLHVLGQDRRLDGRAEGDDLIGVDALAGFLAGQPLDQFLHRRDAGRAADEHHFVNIVALNLGFPNRRVYRFLRLRDEVADQLLELRPRQRHLQMLGPLAVHGSDEGQTDGGLHRRGKLHLRLLGGVFEPLVSLAVLAQVYPILFLEFLGEIVNDALVEVIAAEMGVSRGGVDFVEIALLAGLVNLDIENGDIESATPEVIDHQPGVLLLLAEAVSQGRSRRLVDDPQHIEARDLTGMFGGRALSVIKVGRHCDDGVLDFLAQVRLRVSLQLLQYHRRDLLRRVVLPVNGNRIARSHLALDR